MNKIEKMIKDYRLAVGYRKRGAKEEEGIIINEKIDHESNDFKFIKQNKPEILRILKKEKAEREEESQRKYDEEKRKKLEEEYPQEFKKARETGKDQPIGSWMEPCNDPSEDCSWDAVGRYVKPDGTIYVKRQHTW